MNFDNKIISLLNNAIDIDEAGQDSNLAIKLYCNVLIVIFNEIKELNLIPSSSIFFEKYFKIIENVLDRIKFLQEIIAKKNKQKDGENDELDYLKYIDSPSPTKPSRASSVKGTGTGSGTGMGSLIGTGTIIGSGMGSIIEDSTKRNSLPTTLDAIRREHETKTMQKQSYFHKRLLSTTGRNYVNHLLNERQEESVKFHDKIMNWFTSLTLKISLAIEDEDWKERFHSHDNDREKFDKNNEDQEGERSMERKCKRDKSLSFPSIEDSHYSLFCKFFMEKNHPICIFIENFINRERFVIEESIQNFFSECNLFVDQIVEMLSIRFQLPDYRSIDIRRALDTHLWKRTILGVSIIRAVERLNLEKNANLMKMCECASWDKFLMNTLEIPEKFHDFTHESLVCELRTITSVISPIEKADCLIRVGQKLAFLEPNTEELVCLLSLLIVKSQISNLYSELSLIEGLLPVDLLQSESGYMLATIQTSLSFIEQKYCKNDEN